MRNHTDHLKRARDRLNEFHERIDHLEQQLQELRAQAVNAEERFKVLVREAVDAQTAQAIAQLESKE